MRVQQPLTSAKWRRVTPLPCGMQVARPNAPMGVNQHYATSAGLKPGRYRVVSTLAAYRMGLLTYVCYVVAYRGRLWRCWLQ